MEEILVHLGEFSSLVHLEEISSLFLLLSCKYSCVSKYDILLKPHRGHGNIM